MKIVALMYLEEDNPTVSKLLSEHGVMAYSRLPLEGHGAGAEGWLGRVPAYRSSMAFALVPEALRGTARSIANSTVSQGGCESSIAAPMGLSSTGRGFTVRGMPAPAIGSFRNSRTAPNAALSK